MITTRRSAHALLLAVTLGFTGSLQAADAGPTPAESEPESKAKARSGKLVALSEVDAAWAAKAKAEYPMTTCVVSGEALSSAPEEAYDFVYRQEGSADRFISFCCDGCSKDFGQDEVRFIQKLDEAAAAKK